MDTMIDVSTLSLEDVREEYGILYERYRQLCINSENDAQKIYELKRHLDTALAAEEYLTQELEQATNNDSANNAISVNQVQYQLLQREHAELQLQFNNMKQTLCDENENLCRKLEEMNAIKLQKKSTDEENHMADLAAAERAERLRLLEKENIELLQKLDDLQEENVRHVMHINDRESTVDMLRERLECLEENLRSKRDELEEKTQILESTQDQLSEANGRIALMSAAPESADRKGNSLFAEVDDQRQVMKQLLAAQKRSYMEMKKIYQESQYEIRRLKNENIAMHNELEACSTLFCSSNKTYQNMAVGFNDDEIKAVIGLMLLSRGSPKPVNKIEEPQPEVEVPAEVQVQAQPQEAVEAPKIIRRRATICVDRRGSTPIAKQSTSNNRATIRASYGANVSSTSSLDSSLSTQSLLSNCRNILADLIIKNMR